MQDTKKKNLSQLEQKIFEVNFKNFNSTAIELFHYQHEFNEVYRKYCDLINCKKDQVKTLTDIPFLPISTFKTQQVVSTSFSPQAAFSSSGTSKTTTSKHYVKSLPIYENSFRKGFESFYDAIDSYCILGLLPSYLERKGSSLIYMVNDFIVTSKHQKSGFFLNNREELHQILTDLSKEQQKTLLIGVSFGLLDFAEEHQIPYNENLIVMETGGMKGRRKEMIREELHNTLKKSFQVNQIHSEYGMTELLSQAYSKGEGLFKCPPWMKVLIRKQDDPFSFEENGKTGAINVIDLANIHSCAFIQTDDLGKAYNDENFEVLGRFDASDVRGCNLMIG